MGGGCVTIKNGTSKDEIWERLAELEDKIEDGTLNEIPEGAEVLSKEATELIAGELGVISPSSGKPIGQAIKEKIRKETAREIIEYLQDNGRKYETWYLINELKKQYGVVVEE